MMLSGLPVTLLFCASCHVKRKGPPPHHTVKVEGLKGLDTSIQRRGHAVTLVKRSEVKGNLPLNVKEEVVVVGQHPGVALVNDDVELVEGGVWVRRRDHVRVGVRVAEALDGRRTLRRQRARKKKKCTFSPMSLEGKYISGMGECKKVAALHMYKAVGW